MKFTFILIFLSSLYLQTIAQEVIILNQQNSIPIENVAVFNKNLSVVVYSNNQGVADLSQFSRSDSIFFKHPSIEQIGLSFQDIREMNFVLQIDKRNIIMDDIVVTASRWAEKKREIPFMTDVIRVSDAKIAVLRTSSDILASTGNLMVQKSQGGAGSPVIRGFEANRLLLVIDGVRMNNAIYRSGHLQNSMSLDLGGLDRIEVIYGPSSVIYGSDALGGVIHYYTKTPKLSEKKFLQAGADAAAQFSSANSSKIYHFGLHAGFRRIAFYSSFTGSDFGDIKIGKNRNGFSQNHGKVFSHIRQGMLKDSLVSAGNPEIQPATGYQQYDMTHKVLIPLTRNLKLIGNVQYSTSSRINRFDELYNFQNDKPTYASWYYGPQNRFFSSLRLVSEAKTRFFSDFSVILAYQKIDEDRINRKYNRRNELHQEEDVRVYSLNLDFRKSFSGNQKLEYGFEANYNDVQSDGYNTDIRSNTRTEALSRYPDEGSFVSALSAYTGYKWAPSEKIRLSAGVRYSHSLLYSKFSPEFDMIPFSTVDISTGALTGSASLIYNPHRDWKISFVLSTGFRAPNVDDYGKVRAKDNEVTLPNNKLGPEYAKNAEIGIMKSFNGIATAGGNFYYTYLTNAIVNGYSTYSGKDSLLYNGDMYRIVTNTNSNEAFITGFSLFLNFEVTKDLQFKNTFNYTKGRDVSNDVPLGHIPPVFGRSTVSFDKSFIKAEMYVSYHGRKYARDYSPTGEDNMNYATESGTPSWTTWNINTSTPLGKNVQLQLAVENIFDTYYRVFASGISAPGRNFIITLKASI